MSKRALPEEDKAVTDQPPLKRAHKELDYSASWYLMVFRMGDDGQECTNVLYTPKKDAPAARQLVEFLFEETLPQPLPDPRDGDAVKPRGSSSSSSSSSDDSEGDGTDGEKGISEFMLTALAAPKDLTHLNKPGHEEKRWTKALPHVPDGLRKILRAEGAAAFGTFKSEEDTDEDPVPTWAISPYHGYVRQIHA